MSSDPWLDDVVIPDHPCPRSRSTLAQWYDEAEQQAHLRLGTEETRAVADAKRAWKSRDEKHKHAGRDAVVQLANLGLKFQEIADLLRCEVVDVAMTLSRSHEPAALAHLVHAEGLLRSRPDLSLQDIANEVGCGWSVVQNLAARLGIGTERAKQVQDGGGLKYDADVYERIRQLRANGTSYSRIGKKLGIATTTVAKICHRRHFKVEAVA